MTVDGVLVEIERLMEAQTEKNKYDQKACLYELGQIRRKILGRVDDHIQLVEVAIRSKTQSTGLI